MTPVHQLTQYTDSEIIEKILQGETALYEIIIRRYNPYLYKTGRSYGFNHHDTEDLMQETYLNVYANLYQFEGRSTFKTWIVKIMLNQCYQKKQKFSFQKEIPAEKSAHENSTPMFSNQPDTTRHVINKELSTVLENALQRLSPDYRLVFSLRELNGMSVLEAAEALNISPGNVKVLLSRAKSMLRTEIERMYSTDEIYEFNLIYCDSMVKRVMDVISTR